MARLAAARVEEVCMANPRDCLAAARRLQSLFGDFSEPHPDTLTQAGGVITPAPKNIPSRAN